MTAPIPVSQRHPRADECDDRGRCWWFDPHNGGSWDYSSFDWTCSHWLPAGALPRPGGGAMTHSNPVDAIAQVLAAEGAREPQHAACLVLELLAARLQERFGGSSATADWLEAAVALRR